MNLQACDALNLGRASVCCVVLVFAEESEPAHQTKTQERVNNSTIDMDRHETALDESSLLMESFPSSHQTTSDVWAHVRAELEGASEELQSHSPIKHRDLHLRIIHTIFTAELFGYNPTLPVYFFAQGPPRRFELRPFELTVSTGEVNLLVDSPQTQLLAQAASVAQATPIPVVIAVTSSPSACIARRTEGFAAAAATAKQQRKRSEVQRLIPLLKASGDLPARHASLDWSSLYVSKLPGPVPTHGVSVFSLNDLYPAKVRRIMRSHAPGAIAHWAQFCITRAAERLGSSIARTAALAFIKERIPGFADDEDFRVIRRLVEKEQLSSVHSQALSGHLGPVVNTTADSLTAEQQQRPSANESGASSSSNAHCLTAHANDHGSVIAHVDDCGASHPSMHLSSSEVPRAVSKKTASNKRRASVLHEDNCLDDAEFSHSKRAANCPAIESRI